MSATSKKILALFRSATPDEQRYVTDSILNGSSTYPDEFRFRYPIMTDEEIAEENEMLANIRDEDLLTPEQMLELIENDIQAEHRTEALQSQ